MKYHALSLDMCCPFCGQPNLVYKRSGLHGDIYTAGSIPTDGSTVYVRLFTEISGSWQYVDYAYATASTAKVTTRCESHSRSAILSA